MSIENDKDEIRELLGELELSSGRKIRAYRSKFGRGTSLLIASIDPNSTREHTLRIPAAMAKDFAMMVSRFGDDGVAVLERTTPPPEPEPAVAKFSYGRRTIGGGAVPR